MIKKYQGGIVKNAKGTFGLAFEKQDSSIDSQ